ncbi:hypothetical protein EVAR_55266_1 [Eumeta japonica]|uniref:Reverse transcriptase domain-containing protein n=1 Tax=Eumeta variegata TaxID=151549 RepID=A0A4C1Z5D1_EUMVA|nr:hypothetical protein EVAR_55266_1 [Eumeta japonica]
MRLKVKVGQLYLDPLRHIGLALTRADKDTLILVSSYQKRLFGCANTKIYESWKSFRIRQGFAGDAEKQLEYKGSEKVYDIVERNYLWMYGVSSRLIRALQSLRRGSNVCVRINGAYTYWFDIRGGVGQRCVASPKLFNLLMDSYLYYLKEYECGLRTDKLSVTFLLYTDDQIKLALSACELKAMIVDKIIDSVKKRKNERMEKVKEFVYLGSLFANDGKHERYIERRANAGNKGMGPCESWVWLKKNESGIYAVKIQSLRNMCGVSLKDRCKNSDVRRRCGLKENIVTGAEKFHDQGGGGTSEVFRKPVVEAMTRLGRGGPGCTSGESRHDPNTGFILEIRPIITRYGLLNKGSKPKLPRWPVADLGADDLTNEKTRTSGSDSSMCVPRHGASGSI